MKQMELPGWQPQSFFKKYWHIIALTLIALLSFFLYFYAISKIGYGNAYYAAAIRSMSENFKNFFYASFDPAGLVSVDKPPLALWVQTLFVSVFGYHGWAMLLPQALAGTGSTIMMYVLTAKYFGKPAGLISALVFAVTPAVVVASRNNTMDMQLIFVLLVAVWFLFKAIEKSRWRYLFICALIIGLAFNIKMLQAYMILPAVAVVYLVFSREKISRRVIAVAISTLILVGVSFAWVFAVDLTPAADRPFVGSSTDNRELELVIGHNGLERIYGQSMGGLLGGSKQNTGAGIPRAGSLPPPNGQNANTNGSPFVNQFFQNAQNGTTLNPPNSQNANSTMQQRIFGRLPLPGQGVTGSARIGGFGGNDIGTAGVFRLWAQSLYGQATWLFILAMFCIVMKTGKFDPKKLTLKQGVFIFWIGWLIAMYGFFSFADFWHRYYLCMVAPGIAGLAGPGIAEMVRAFREKRGWKQFLLPASLAVTFAFEAAYVWGYPDLRVWLEPVMIATAAAALALMAFHYFKPRRIALLAATVLMLASLLAAPLYWSLTVVMYPPQNSTLPYAGPELASTIPVPGMTPNQESLTTGDSGTISLENYLVAHYREGSYLIVSERADDVAQFIVDTGLPAVAYGGFLGTDKAMTLSRLQELAQQGKVTYFWVAGGNSYSELNTYAEKNAKLINPSDYNVSDDQTIGQSGGSLYLFGS